MSQPDPKSLAGLQRLARTDTDGAEKEVLSLHDRFFARVLAPPLAWLALRLGLSADGLTFLSIMTGVSGALLLAGALPLQIGGVALLQLSYLLDCADGDVARARGTACLDGYLRDTVRHYLMGPLIFVGLTLNACAQHPQRWLIALGLLGTFFATRIVGDLSDRVTLEGLLKRLQRPASAPLNATVTQQPAARGAFALLRSLFLPDLALMNWGTLAVLLDCAGAATLWAQTPAAGWTALHLVLLLLAPLQIVLKLGGLVLLWRRGVAARVEELAARIEDRHRDGRA